MKRFTTGLVFGAAVYAIAWAAGIAAAVVAYALTDH